MTARALLLTFAAGFASASPALADNRQTYSLDSAGQWKATETPASPAATRAAANRASSELDRVAAEIERGQYDAAFRHAVAWLNAPANRTHPARDRGLYLAAVALHDRLDLVRAFYYCDELLDEHPESARFQDALEMQYDIADRYLRGLRDKFLGMRVLPRDDAAIEMLFRIQQRAPGSPVAEKALLRTADYYWADSQFDLAGDAYQAYVRSYPRSPKAPLARLREAYANLAQFRGPAFDPRPVLNARQQLTSLMGEYPDLAKQEDLQGKVLLADRQLARKLVIRADYYRRTGEPASAAQICRRAIELFPSLPETDDARAMLAKLEGGAQ